MFQNHELSFPAPLIEGKEASPEKQQGFWSRLLTPKGRIGRLEYFASSLILNAASMIYLFGLMGTGVLMIGNSENSELSMASLGILSFFGVTGLGSLALLSFFQTFKRLHDLGRSSWYSLTLFIPILNIATAIGMLLLKGQARENKYGPDPKGIQTLDTSTKILAVLSGLVYVVLYSVMTFGVMFLEQLTL